MPSLRNIGIFVFCLLVLGTAQAQQPAQPAPGTAPAPATKLEAFSAKSGSVVIKGFTNVGTINGRFGEVYVDAREFRDAANPKLKSAGLSIRVKEAGRLEREDSSFVDYDEIDSLLQGIDYISKADHGVTPMSDFEVEYKTKGGFGITVFSTPKGIQLGVSSGRFGPVMAYLNVEDLVRLRGMIQNGKTKIDSAEQTKQ